MRMTGKEKASTTIQSFHVSGTIEKTCGVNRAVNGSVNGGVNGGGTCLREHGDVEDDKVEAERHRHRQQQPRVLPRRHLQQRAVLRERIQSVEHLDRHLRYGECGVT